MEKLKLLKCLSEKTGLRVLLDVARLTGWTVVESNIRDSEHA
jgi:hypothetical protein